jgi:hypothetical protein
MSENVSKIYLNNLLQEYDISVDEQYWRNLVNEVYDKVYGDDPEKEADKKKAKDFINGILTIFTDEHFNIMKEHGMSEDDIQRMYDSKVALLIDLKETLDNGFILPSFEIKTYSPSKLSKKLDILEPAWEVSSSGRPDDCNGSRCSMMGGKKTRMKKSKRINKKFQYYSKKTSRKKTSRRKTSRRKTSRRNYRKK